MGFLHNYSSSKVSSNASYYYLSTLISRIADLWILVIGFTTWLILTEKRTAANWVQNNQWILWAFPWVTSILAAGIGWAIWGYKEVVACMYMYTFQKFL